MHTTANAAAAGVSDMGNIQDLLALAAVVASVVLVVVRLRRALRQPGDSCGGGCSGCRPTPPLVELDTKRPSSDR